jgi:hypothetical protein
MANKTYEEWLEAVEEDGFTLLKVPEDMKTEEMCMAAVSAFQTDDALRVLQSVPKKFLTQDLCSAAVDRYADAIEAVPEDLLTEEMCLVAVRQGEEAMTSYLGSVPEKFRTKAVCLEALENSHINDEADFFSCIPEEFLKDPEFLGQAVKHISVWEYIPKSAWEDQTFCRAAIEIRGWWLSYVPEEFKTLEVCVAAIKQEPGNENEVLESIPVAMQKEVKKAAGLEDN